MCWAVSIAQAIRHTGRYYMSLEDLAKALNIRSTGALMHAATQGTQIKFIKQLSTLLTELKIPHTPVGVQQFEKTGWSLKQVLEAGVPAHQRGVLLFAVRSMKGTEEVGHALYTAPDSTGVLHIYDRSGAVVRTSPSSGHLYGPEIDHASIKSMDMAIFIHDAFDRRARRQRG